MKPSYTEKDGYMGSVTVGAKGQIVIPKAVRDMFGIKPGSILLLLAHPGQGIAIPRAEDCDEVRRDIFRKIQGAKEDGTK